MTKPSLKEAKEQIIAAELRNLALQARENAIAIATAIDRLTAEIKRAEQASASR